MNNFVQDLLQLQQNLVYASTSIAALAVLLIGMGFVVSGASTQFGYRLKRLGLQTLGGVVLVLSLHAVSVGIYGGQIPVALLIGVYGVVGLLLLQGLLNLLFGPTVGNGVISRLLGGLIILIIALGFASYQGFFGP